MLTEFEAHKLRDAMQQELEATPGVVSECAVMLLLVGGFAWFGTSPMELAVPAWVARSPPNLLQPEPESKAAFDERRRRYIEANPDSHVAREDRNQTQKDAHADGGYFAFPGE